VLRLQGNDAWGMKFLQTIGKRETRTVVSNVKFVCKLAAGKAWMKRMMSYFIVESFCCLTDACIAT
jgi:hypothetical protein